MAGEQRQPAVGNTDLEGIEAAAVAPVHRAAGLAQPRQGPGHRRRPGEPGGTGIGTELPVAREPGGHQGSGDPEQQLQGPDQGRRWRRLPITVALAAWQQDHDRPRQEHHEGVHHALQQRHRHHVAVAHVAQLMGQHRFELRGGHALEDSARYGHQGLLGRGAGGEGIPFGRVVDAHLRHRQAGSLRQGCHRRHKPVILARIQHLHPHHSLG